ncbi:phytoene/squalene synthase family protein [Granulosicoccaceae sp. 1_MG-2023]|nr:phytoene/squalene synthase family protein [Granulosicoccaceae sp. 1_MG-2023]
MTDQSDNRLSLRVADVFQRQMLACVSRSFALTIPRLPPSLSRVVGNAYLICRLADVIEDDPRISQAQTASLLALMIQILQGNARHGAFAARVLPLLGAETKSPERRLVAGAEKIFRLYASLPESSQQAILQCVTDMTCGMRTFAPEGRYGLADQASLDAYCYCVAGVVGQMLTRLFCDYADDIAVRRPQLQALSVSFGEALQLTNILKDIWDDLDRGYCWLPRDRFTAAGVNLDHLARGTQNPAFAKCQAELVALAHGHLANALEYTLLIPPRHRDIRIFCLWAIFLALPTLRKVHASADAPGLQPNKISKIQALLLTRLTALTAGSDTAQRLLFRSLGAGLPFKAVDPAALPDSVLVPDETVALRHA